LSTRNIVLNDTTLVATVTNPNGHHDGFTLGTFGFNAAGEYVAGDGLGFLVPGDVLQAAGKTTVSGNFRLMYNYPTATRVFVCLFVDNYDGTGFHRTIADIPTSRSCVEVHIFNSASDVPAPAGSVNHRTIRPGAQLGFSGKGFWAGETVDIVVYSDPVNLGSVVADGNGNVSGTVTIPRTLPVGAHTLVLTGRSSGVVVSIPFVVGSVPGASTDVVVGSHLITGLAAFAVLGGGTAIAAGLARRRRSDIS
jgi:hypothetical protein